MKSVSARVQPVLLLLSTDARGEKNKMIGSEVQAGGGALTHTQPVNENYINTLLIP